MQIGARMKYRRKSLGLSAEQVAERLGVSAATIYRYEKGDIEKLPGNILEPLSMALETTPAYLMGWEDTGNQTSPSSWSARLLKAYKEAPVSRRESACDVLRIPYVDPDAATQDVPPSRPGVLMPNDAPHHTTGEEADAYTDREDELREMEKEPPSNVG